MTCEDPARGIGYGSALSQLALTLGVVLFTPGITISSFVAYPVIVNSTDTGAMQGTAYHMYPAVIVLIVSGITALFSNLTLQAEERGSLDMDYSAENMHTVPVWDHAFWSIFAGYHFFIILLLCSPSDLFAVMLSFMLVTYFAMQGISPKPYETNGTKESLNMLGYAAGIAIAFNYIPPIAPTGRTMCLSVMVILDYILAIGHTWDHNNTTVRTAANCRLFYACSISIYSCIVYAIWHDNLRE